MSLEALETLFRDYSLLENLAVFPGMNGVENETNQVATGTTFEATQPENRQVPVKVEVEHLDTYIHTNDDDFYQQSDEPEGTKRLANQNVMNVMPPDWFVNNDIRVPDYDDVFLPTTLKAAIKVEMETVDNASSSVVDATTEKQNADQQSMLLDPMLSEIDVSSLILLNGTKASEPDRIHWKGKREVQELDGNIYKTDDTPVTVRRSIRKRSFTEVFKIDTPVRTPAKRRRLRKLSSLRKVRPQANTKVTGGAPALKEIASVQVPSQKPEEAEEKVADNDLKIILKKYAPINPVDTHRIGNHRFRKGLLSSMKHISASLYFSPGIEPKAMPEFRSQSEIGDFDKPNKKFSPAKTSVGMKEVKDMMRMEWIKNYNIIGNYRAHGQKVLEKAGKKLTPDGNAVRGSIAFVNLDNIYDNLLNIQESIIQPGIGLKSEAGPSSSPLPLTSATPSTSTAVPDLNNTFGNEFNFANDYFEDDDITDSLKYPDFEGITGAIPVNGRKLNDAFLAKHTVFSYNGESYMVNPAVVTVVRTSDELIENIMSTPKKVSFASPFYSALTTYFDKRNE